MESARLFRHLVLVAWTALVSAFLPVNAQIVVSGNRLSDEAPALLIYSETGVLQREILVTPPPGLSDFVLRDVTVDRHGRLHVVVRSHVASNGNLTLCTYDGKGWSYLTVPGWSQVGVTYYGGFAVNDDYLFYPDQSFGSDQTIGILRFPLDDLSQYVHFPTKGFHTVTMGLNGLLYASDRDGECHLFHPETMQMIANLGRFILYRGDSVIDLCVGPDGDIFTIDLGNDLNHFDPFGTFIAELENIGPCGDIEIRADGRLVVGLANQKVLVGATDLSGFTSFTTHPVNDPAAWIRNHLSFSPSPALPSPVAPLTEITRWNISTRGLELHFQRLPGVRYHLWKSETLRNWTELPTRDSGSGPAGLFQLETSQEAKPVFFRIESRFPDR